VRKRRLRNRIEALERRVNLLTPEPVDNRLAPGSRIALSVAFEQIKFFDGDEEVRAAWVNVAWGTYGVALAGGGEEVRSAVKLRAQTPSGTWLSLVPPENQRKF